MQMDNVSIAYLVEVLRGFLMGLDVTLPRLLCYENHVQ